MKIKALFLAILAGGLLMGCSNKGNLAKVSGNWETSALEINGVAQEICVSNMTVTVKSSDSVEINGNAGVNHYFGSATIKGNTFKASDNAGSTKMAGDPRAMEFEDNFFAVLFEADTIDLFEENGASVLTLKSSKSGNKISFTKK